MTYLGKFLDASAAFPMWFERNWVFSGQNLAVTHGKIAKKNPEPIWCLYKLSSL